LGPADALRDAHAAGRARWASLPALPLEDFVEHLTRKLPHGGDPVAYVRSLLAEDLYLACACTQGPRGAVEAFDVEFLSRVPGSVRHLGRAPGFGEEIYQ
jgi:RNA polymerase sigma-70 factor (ECF subfamily)